MRPSRRLILIALLALAGTVALALTLPAATGLRAAGVLWAGLVLAGLADLLATPGPRRITLRAELPEQGFVGAEAALRLHPAAPLPRGARLRLSHSADLRPLPAELTPAPGVIDWPLRLLRRGSGRVTRIWLAYPSRLGLFEMLPSWPADHPIAILPDTRPVLSGEIQTQMLPLTEGQKTTRLRGQGAEFHQLREFQPDMDPRSIDWKHSARMHRLIARETRAERNHQIILCLDKGHLMGAHLGDLTRFDLALNAALALAWAGGIGGDTVGFYSFGARPGALIPPRPGRRAFGLIQQQGATLFPEDEQTNHTLGLTHLGGLVSRRSLIVIFSDFADNVTVDLLVENIAVLTRQHLVLYVALRDPTQAALMRPIGSDPQSIAEAVAARRMHEARQQVIDRLHRLGVLCLDCEPGRLTPALISRYMDIKLRGQI